jgi:hypothetical protein
MEANWLTIGKSFKKKEVPAPSLEASDSKKEDNTALSDSHKRRNDKRALKDMIKE